MFHCASRSPYAWHPDGVLKRISAINLSVDLDRQVFSRGHTNNPLPFDSVDLVVSSLPFLSPHPKSWLLFRSSILLFFLGKSSSFYFTSIRIYSSQLVAGRHLVSLLLSQRQTLPLDKMKFTIAALFALVAVASASNEGKFPAGDTARLRYLKMLMEISS